MSLYAPRAQLRTRAGKGQGVSLMNILILGGGGREHSLAWAVLQNPKCDRLVVAPGNAGIAAIADCADLEYWTVRWLPGLLRKKPLIL